MPTAFAAAPPAGPLTAEEFVERYSHLRAELVDGQLLEVPMGGAKHGKVCVRAAVLIGQFADAHHLGHVMGNDTAVVVARNPDTARGPDVLFVSYAKLPKGGEPDGPLAVPPDLVVEVKSPSDTNPQLLIKAGQYLAAGVTVVVVLDPKSESAAVCRAGDLFPQRLHNGDELTLPDVLPGFAARVADFFA